MPCSRKSGIDLDHHLEERDKAIALPMEALGEGGVTGGRSNRAPCSFTAVDIKVKAVLNENVLMDVFETGQDC